MKTRIIPILAIVLMVLVLVVVPTSVLAAPSGDVQYAHLSLKIEQLEKQIPDGQYFPWSELSTNERIKICKFELRILDCMAEKLTYEEAHGLPPSTTWSYIRTAQANVGHLLDELLAQRGGGS